ncbi:hypothetical protein [Saccharopolyspora cebuensis]|uniref:Major facilitator superfamily (MFS) profile domain-containing protein n=1 Tax=Saccharopolyspora cebuensis TaxID=418759 RepID=A0ABV4CMU9_9PSEU
MSGARITSLVFAVLGTLLAVPLLAFLAFVGIWSFAVPCTPGGDGTCGPMGLATAVSCALVLIGAVALWFPVARSRGVGRAVLVGVLGAVVAPLLALAVFQITTSAVG